VGEIKTLEQLSLISAFIVPGLVAMFVRCQFLTGRIDTSKDALISFFTLSLIWAGITSPILIWLGDMRVSLLWQVLAWLLWAVVGPAALGVLLGLSASRGWFRRVMGRLGMRAVHVLPTAWDWKFGTLNASWVTVTMKDGSRISGFVGAQSFASSDPKERDFYIEQVWKVDDDNQWTRHGEWGVLIPHGEIRCIEFMPDGERKQP